MTIVSKLTEKQKAQIPFYIEKWQAKCLLTTPIVRSVIEQGIQDVHQEIGLQPPHDFIYYSSPAAMWREFKVWRPKITRVLTQFWRYQIPLCNPFAIQRFGSPGNKLSAFNFAAKRYSPHPDRAMCETDDSDETFGTVIEKLFHAELWKRFSFEVPFDWGLLGYYPCGGYEPPHDYLWERADKEDPSNQMHYQDYCILSPQQWLLQELACVEFCNHVLGINRNERLYAGLEAIVEYGSFCGLFGGLCIVCERPSQIKVQENSFKLVFRDGSVFAYHKLDKNKSLDVITQ